MRHALQIHIGALVELTDDRLGVVVDVNRGEALRPVVRLVRHAGGEHGELDLAKHPDIGVRKVLQAG
ncbi:MAG TPA: hypothetical protein VFK80_09150 [Limnochordia bacterium]|nr:hypothetical protein [Limnochordia bacterium]